MSVIHAADIGAPPTVPVLTQEHLDRLGTESVMNLARLAFKRSHREYRQYDGWLEQKDDVRLIVVTRDPHPAHGTFSRYEVGDVLLAWTAWDRRAYGFVPETTAFCPRVGWNVAMTAGCFTDAT